MIDRMTLEEGKQLADALKLIAEANPSDIILLLDTYATDTTIRNLLWNMSTIIRLHSHKHREDPQ